METLIGIAALLGLGLAAQWIAWRTHLPAIILLLIFGFVFGKGRIEVGIHSLMDQDLLFTIVSTSVAVILFEGGLGLKLGDLRKHGRTVTRLITVGAVVTWVLSALAAYLLIGLSFEMSLLVGAILIVSGPTVVLPLLRHINPRGRTGPILTWEGIAIDPVGAVVALLVFEGFDRGGGAATGHAVLGLLKTVLIGGGLGALGGWALVQLLKRYWIPDHLHIPAALALVIGVFAISHAGQHESGLLAVTVMGVWAANSKVNVQHILEFKEHLRVVLISSLFILLASRLENSEIAQFDWTWVAFLLALLFVVRPAAVWVSTRGSKLSREEKLFLAWMCPRGIVAAAVASVFGSALYTVAKADVEAAKKSVAAGAEGANVALESASLALSEASLLVPLVFFVIVGTVVIYGLTAGLFARRLGLALPNPQGVLLIGAHGWARDIAAALQKEGIVVRVVDLNRRNIRAARMAELPAERANVLDGHVADELDLFGIGRVMALTPNDEVNTLVSMRFAHRFGRSKTYQLPRDTVPSKDKPSDAAEEGGRQLFGPAADYFDLSTRFGRGRIRVTALSETFDYEAFLAEHGERALPLFSLDAAGKLTVGTADKPLTPGPGDRVVALIDEPPAGADADTTRHL